MARNSYFNVVPKDGISNENLLVEDLLIESLKIYGFDVYYIPRSEISPETIDKLFGEDSVKQFKNAFLVEMYLSSYNGFEGPGDILSKFGLEIQDELTFVVSRRRFRFSTNIQRPREGDLIYVPMMAGLFEITFVEHEEKGAIFYTLGRKSATPYIYEMRARQFVYSNETINTGFDEVDDAANPYYSRIKLTLASGLTYYEEGEIVYQGSSLNTANATGQVFSFDGKTNVIEITKTKGMFSNTAPLVGSSSLVSRNVLSVNNLQVMDNMFDDVSDNYQLENEGDAILDFSEENPFGEP